LSYRAWLFHRCETGGKDRKALLPTKHHLKIVTKKEIRTD